MLNERISKRMVKAHTFGTAATSIVLVLFASIALIACAPQSDSSKTGTEKRKGAVDNFNHLTAEEKVFVSDAFADEGEEKLGFGTMNDAWGKFSEALQLNPENHRATFWKEIIKPFLETKGILGRIRPLYLQHEGGSERYRSLLQKMRESSSVEYFKFMTDAPANIDSEALFREQMDRVIVSLDTLRTFLKTNKDREYSLRAPVKFLTGGQKPEKGNRCAALKIMTSKFQGCPESGMLNFKVNRADLEMMQIMVAMQMLQYALLEAYSFNSTAKFSIIEGRKNKEFISHLMSGHSGGLLERNHLASANSVATDWLVAQRYFMQNQREVCKNGPRAEANRPGFLMSEGFCLSDVPGSADVRTLEMLEIMVQGRPVRVQQKFAEKPVSIYPLKFFTSPPRDITPLLPTQYNENGAASAFNDSAYNEYFAEGSINAIMRAGQLEEYQNGLRWPENEAFEKNFPESAKSIGRPK